MIHLAATDDAPGPGGTGTLVNELVPQRRRAVPRWKRPRRNGIPEYSGEHGRVIDGHLRAGQFPVRTDVLLAIPVRLHEAFLEALGQVYS